MSRLSESRSWAKQASVFHRDGVLVLDRLVPDTLVERAAAELSKLVEEGGPHVFFEADGTTVRAIYGLHRYDGVWRDLAELPALNHALDAIFGEPYYLFQWKINPKAPRVGQQWEWHRDFIYWHTGDGMPKPEALTVALFLSDVTPASGPLRVVRGSHRRQLSPAEQAQIDPSGRATPSDENWSSFVDNGLPYTISDEEAERLAAEHGVVEGVGHAGTVTLFHSNAIHGSLPNTSDQTRVMGFLTFNPVSNAPREAGSRPHFFVNNAAVASTRPAQRR